MEVTRGARWLLHVLLTLFSVLHKVAPQECEPLLTLDSVTATKADVSWSFDCPTVKLSSFKFEVAHQSYLGCDDKSLKANIEFIKNIPASARQLSITNGSSWSLLAHSRYLLTLKAIPKTGRAIKTDLDFSTPLQLPQHRLEVQEEQGEQEEGSIEVSWGRPPPWSCTQGEELPGGIVFWVEDRAGAKLQEDQLSPTTTSVKVSSLQPASPYSLHLVLSDPQGRYDQSAVVEVTRETAPAAGQDQLMVGVGVCLGLLTIVLLLALGYWLCRRHRAGQQKSVTLGEGGYSPQAPILRPGRGDTLGPGKRTSTDPLPPRPGHREPIYQEIGQAPLAREEEEEEELLQARVPTPASVTEEDEEGYLRPNFHRFELLQQGEASEAPIPMVSYGSSRDDLKC